MILESVRIVADWLRHQTHGVNALAAAVPRDTGVTQAPTVTVLDETTSPGAARDQVPDTGTAPWLLVGAFDSPLEQTVPAVRPFPPDAQVEVLIRYVDQETDTALAVRDMSQTMRAIWRSMGLLMTTSVGEAARSRASVQLIGIPAMRAVTATQGLNDALVTGGVLVTCRVRDLHASS